MSHQVSHPLSNMGANAWQMSSATLPVWTSDIFVFRHTWTVSLKIQTPPPQLEKTKQSSAFFCILFGWQLKEIKPYLIELLKNIYKYNCFESTKSLTHLLDSGWMEMSIKSFHSLTHTFTLYHYKTAFQQTHFSSFVFVCHDSWGLLYH